MIFLIGACKLAVRFPGMSLTGLVWIVVTGATHGSPAWGTTAAVLVAAAWIAGKVYISRDRAARRNRAFGRALRADDPDRPHAVYWYWKRFDDGTVRSWYTGETSRPDLRADQHARDSWWFRYADHDLTQVAWYPSKLIAKRIEREQIRDLDSLCNIEFRKPGAVILTGPGTWRRKGEAA